MLLCDKNKLKQLPPIPPSLSVLWCDENRLTVLPELPTSMTMLMCDFNPWNKHFKKYIDSADPIGGVQAYYTKQGLYRKHLRHVLALQHTFGMDATNPLNEDVLNIIGTFLSGKKGSLKQQIGILKDGLIL